ncbi:MAG: PTS sugar transporter subunit IIC [bacterium]
MSFLFSPQLLLAAFVGAVMELDTYFVGMTLFSQPIIVGGITGLIFHDLTTGILIGSIVQLIWISPPVGAYVPPSSTAIAFTATALALNLPTYVTQSNPQELMMYHQSLLMYSIALGVAAGYYVGQADIWNRKLNTIIVHIFEPGILAGRQSSVFAVQLFSVLAKFLKDFIGIVLVLGLGVELAAKIYNSLPSEVIEGLSRALWLMPVIGLAVVYELFRSKFGSMIHIVSFIVCYILLLNNVINPLFLTLIVLIVCSVVVYTFVWKKKDVLNGKK